LTNCKLLAMANQIATFFIPYSEAEAVAGIRDHIVAFWTPKMRRDVVAQWRADEQGVEPRVAKALSALQAPEESPISKTMAGPQSAGALASDAG
jgi:formate dehydrogenase subunit delta